MHPYSTKTESGTTVLTGLRCYALTFLDDTVFSTLTGMGGDTGATYPKGVTIFGFFTAITLASGAIVFYETPPVANNV